MSGPRSIYSFLTCRAARPSKQRGFTMVELLSVMCIIAVGLAIAVPNLAPFIERNKIAMQANDLLAAINLARTQAVMRAQVTKVCPISDPNSADCAVTEWSNGVAVRTNVAGRDGALRVLEPQGQGVIIEGNSNPIAFNAMGFLESNTSPPELKVANKSGSEQRSICIASHGQARIVSTVQGGSSTGRDCTS